MDRPIHLAELTICHRDDHTEASVNVPVWITQSSLDGMLEVIKFLEGFRMGGNTGDIPGTFDLVMFYRTLKESIRNAETAARDEAFRVSQIPEGEPTDINPDYISPDGQMRDRFGRRVPSIDEFKKQ